MIPFKRRGINLHDPKGITGDKLAKKEGLPVSPFNVIKAAQANIEEPEDQTPDPKNEIRRYGGSYES